ncbi:MAG: DUF1573 domain-containing protein [Prevotellaceae bacterium]|jgi:hypothetical protein|nr:DUF1573 domain-containing protein [Prevotellaceae bacterium]
MKRVSVFLAASIAAISLNAQSITFNELVHDFGVIREEAGPVSHEFVFTNTGDNPLVISKVTPACGCTVSSWTKSPVKPGETGSIIAIYTPLNRVFPFNKALTVASNAVDQSAQTVLTVKGSVLPKPENYRITYRDSVGDLRIKYLKELSFPKITMRARSSELSLNVANVSETEPITVEYENVPSYVIISPKTLTLKPREKGNIKVLIDGNKREIFGFVRDLVTIKVGEKRGTMSIGSVVAEEFPSLSGPDWDNGPRVKVGGSVINLAKASSTSIEISNTGKSDLIIASFTSDNPNLLANFNKSIKVKPGKSTNIKLESKDPQKSTGNVYFTTNDPRNSLLKYQIINK